MLRNLSMAGEGWCSLSHSDRFAPPPRAHSLVGTQLAHRNERRTDGRAILIHRRLCGSIFLTKSDWRNCLGRGVSKHFASPSPKVEKIAAASECDDDMHRGGEHVVYY